MRIYEVTLSGRYMDEDEKCEFSFTKFFSKLPTKESVVAAFTDLANTGTSFLELETMKKYIPMIPETHDLNFADNSGMGRAVFPKLQDHEFQIPPSATECCYLRFDYHDTWE